MVGVVLLNYNTPQDVLRCVEHIRKQTSCAYKIYLVDNASTDNSWEQFRKEFAGDAGVELFLSECNNGFSAGNNIGIRKAIEDGCEYICVINADVILLNDAITVLAEKMEADTTIGVAAPVIATPNVSGESQYARNKLTFGAYLSEKTPLGKIAAFRNKYPRYQILEQEFTKDYKFFGMTYGCMYVARSSYLSKTGLLDEDVFLFNEEDIMAYKLEELCLYTLISPEAKVLHNHHSSVSKTSVANRVYHLRISAMIVLRKYAAVPLVWLAPLIWLQNLMWWRNARKYNDFRMMQSDYFAKHRQIMTMPRGLGLKQIKK